MSVAASTSIGKGDVKTKVVFTEQGGDVCVCVIAIPVSPCSFLPLWCSVPVTGPHDIHVTRFSLSQIIVSWQPLSLERLMGSSLSTQLQQTPLLLQEGDKKECCLCLLNIMLPE